MSEYNNNRPSLDDLDDEAVRHPERYPNKTLTRIGKVIKWFFVSLAALVFVVMIWRINTMESVPANMKALTMNDRLYAAYLQSGEDLRMITQSKLDPVSTNEEAYGYFWIADSVIIPDAQQLQLVVRYNNSTLEHLADDFKLTDIPSRDDEVIAVRLRVITDATPGDPTDNDDEAAWTSHILEPTGMPRVGKKDVYNYRRYVFDDVSMTDDLIGLAVDFYYVGATDAEAPIASLFAYYGEAENETVKLTKDDANALKEFGNNGASAEK
ncbi:MAG: hypothetical protein IJY66_06420 [Clostridia bacterium]|nr:hypothetical protein [Clostridia bacterium]